MTLLTSGRWGSTVPPNSTVQLLPTKKRRINYLLQHSNGWIKVRLLLIRINCLQKVYKVINKWNQLRFNSSTVTLNPLVGCFFLYRILYIVEDYVQNELKIMLNKIFLKCYKYTENCLNIVISLDTRRRCCFFVVVFFCFLKTKKIQNTCIFTKQQCCGNDLVTSTQLAGSDEA